MSRTRFSLIALTSIAVQLMALNRLAQAQEPPRANEITVGKYTVTIRLPAEVIYRIGEAKTAKVDADNSTGDASRVTAEVRHATAEVRHSTGEFPFSATEFPFAVTKFPFPVTEFPFSTTEFPFPVTEVPFSNMDSNFLAGEPIYAEEAVDIEFRLTDNSNNDPVLGAIGVVKAVTRASISMPAMAGMPAQVPKIQIGRAHV